VEDGKPEKKPKYEKPKLIRFNLEYGMGLCNAGSANPSGQCRSGSQAPGGQCRDGSAPGGRCRAGASR